MLSAAQMHNKAEDAGTFLEKREARKEKEHSVAPKIHRGETSLEGSFRVLYVLNIFPLVSWLFGIDETILYRSVSYL